MTVSSKDLDLDLEVQTIINESTETLERNLRADMNINLDLLMTYLKREKKDFKPRKYKKELLENIELKAETDTFDNEGLLCCISLRFIGLENLTELEFYGLKVVLNEKPKLRRKEQERISRESYFARDMNGNLYEYLDKPRQSKEFGRWQTDYAFIQINSDLFTFITWESGKAWSKSELMELKVID